MMRRARPMKAAEGRRGVPAGRARARVLLLLLGELVDGGLRLLEVERALVDRSAGDDAGDAFGLDRAQRLDVGETGEAAARDHRHAQLARELERRIDVDAGE